jgi:hypothetical protein
MRMRRRMALMSRELNIKIILDRRYFYFLVTIGTLQFLALYILLFKVQYMVWELKDFLVK